MLLNEPEGSLQDRHELGLQTKVVQEMPDEDPQEGAVNSRTAGHVVGGPKKSPGPSRNVAKQWAMMREKMLTKDRRTLLPGGSHAERFANMLAI